VEAQTLIAARQAVAIGENALLAELEDIFHHGRRGPFSVSRLSNSDGGD
jgi:hypothetical protein